MNLITTVPAGRQLDVGVFSFGQMPNKNPSSVNLTIKHSGSVVTGFYFGNSTTLVSLSMPNIVAIDPNNFQGGGFSTQQCSTMTSLSVPLLEKTGGDIIVVTTACGTQTFPSLTFCGSTFAYGDLTHLTGFSAPVLSTVGQLQPAGGGPGFASDTWNFPKLSTIIGTGGQGMVCSGNYSGTNISMPLCVTINGNVTAVSFCPHLTNIDLSSWLPTNGKQYFFTSEPISSATTNLLLARGVANPAFVSGTLNISGTPTGQGVTDKATLQGRGVSVTTN